MKSKDFFVIIAAIGAIYFLIVTADYHSVDGEFYKKYIDTEKDRLFNELIIPTSIPTKATSVETKLVFDYTKTEKPHYLVGLALDKYKEMGGTVPEVIYCLISAESNWVTDCHNTNGEDSRGLLQVNTMAHKTANKQRLFEPRYNLEFQIPTLVEKEREGIRKGLTGIELIMYVARYGQRPNFSNDNVLKYYTRSVVENYAEYHRNLIEVIV